MGRRTEKDPGLKSYRVRMMGLSQKGMMRDPTTIEGEGSGREGLHDGLWKEVSAWNTFLLYSP